MVALNTTVDSNKYVQLHINGRWTNGVSDQRLPILNPATEEIIGKVCCAATDDLDQAAIAAAQGFEVWRDMPAIDRYRLMRKAAVLLGERSDEIAHWLTLENGKPLPQAKAEVSVGIDVIDWCAEEAKRTYGRIIPARLNDVAQMVVKEPVGPVAAFSPWNFPINQAVRKLAAALAAGCSIVLKGPEETPISCAALVQCFVDAGIPNGVVNLVFGSPGDISRHLIAHPLIRKISFTGSTNVGKQLAMLAGQYMKRATMELGGHAPVVVFADADFENAINVLVNQKFRNAGQVCTSPTRFIVEESIFDKFVNAFSERTAKLRVGDGLDPVVDMGPLAHERRITAMTALIDDATLNGAKVVTGGHRLERKGYFFAPTILTNLNPQSRIMNEEPFGPVALMIPFTATIDAITEANRLPYGLAAYAYTSSLKNAALASSKIESGVISVNHNGVAIPETPFGGIKDSGYGSEGGTEAIDAYINTKFITQRNL